MTSRSCSGVSAKATLATGALGIGLAFLLTACGGEAQPPATAAVEPKTPAAESQTPATESQTPAIEPQTSASESQTPAVEPQTSAAEQDAAERSRF